MKAVLLGYRRGGNTQYEKYAIVEVPGASHRDAYRLLGRKVVWVDRKGRRWVGRLVRTHGKNGRFLARFRKPLPGQALGSEVQLA